MYSKLQDGNFMVCGYVAKNAELKQVGEKKSNLCRWSVKVGEKQNGDSKEAIWTNCQAWNDTAKVAANIKKGDTVLCIGKIETNEYEGKTYKNLVCEFISVMKSEVSNIATADMSSNDELSEFEEILGDGELPF